MPVKHIFSFFWFTFTKTQFLHHKNMLLLHSQKGEKNEGLRE